jgi:hypothetical protein
MENNIFFPVEGNQQVFYTYNEYGTSLDEENQLMYDALLSWQTDYSDPGISSDNGYILLPPSTEFENMAPYSHDWFEQVSFKGAFGSNNWIEGWTLLHESELVND